MIKFVTFNIRCSYAPEQDGYNCFGNRKGLIKKKLEAEKPDIVCFQEVLPHVAEWLRNELTDYYVLGCGRSAELENEQMTIAFLKERFNLISMETYWMSENPFEPGSRYEEQSNWPRTCTELLLEEREDKKVFRVINTHLDHVGAKARELGMQQILRKIQSEAFMPSVPVILAGDFNAEPMDEEMRVMWQADCENATEGIGITYHAFHEDGIKPMCIDYIFLFKQKAAWEFKAQCVTKWEECEDGIYLSDHYPICAELIY